MGGGGQLQRWGAIHVWIRPELINVNDRILVPTFRYNLLRGSIQRPRRRIRMCEVSSARVGSKSCAKMVQANYARNLERRTPMDNRQGSFAEMLSLYHILGGKVGGSELLHKLHYVHLVHPSDTQVHCVYTW